LEPVEEEGREKGRRGEGEKGRREKGEGRREKGEGGGGRRGEGEKGEGVVRGSGRRERMGRDATGGRCRTLGERRSPLFFFCELPDEGPRGRVIPLASPSRPRGPASDIRRMMRTVRVAATIP
jgi:hypothetical protein